MTGNTTDKETKASAKMELVVNITLGDGTVISRQVETRVPDKCEMDMDSIPGVLRSFDKYERAVIAARDKIIKEISDDYMDEVAKKKK